MKQGANIGETFIFDYPTNQQTVQQAAPARQQRQAPDFDIIGEPASGLEVIDDLTSNYYSSFANLKNFAKTIWNN